MLELNFSDLGCPNQLVLRYIKNISISKTTTSSRKLSQKNEIHDQPEKMLKIFARAKHFQELI